MGSAGPMQAPLRPPVFLCFQVRPASHGILVNIRQKSGRSSTHLVKETVGRQGKTLTANRVPGNDFDLLHSRNQVFRKGFHMQLVMACLPRLDHRFQGRSRILRDS